MGVHGLTGYDSYSPQLGQAVNMLGGWDPRVDATAWQPHDTVLQRLEAGGEIRGGRFIAGLSGEQFALPEAIGLLREVRRAAPSQRWTCLSACDPAAIAAFLAAHPDKAAAWAQVRGIEPADVASLVLFLASDDARFCTGHEYWIDAGWR